MVTRARMLVVVAIAAAAAATILIAVLPGLSFAYHSKSAHVAIEAAGAVTALMAGFIVYGRLVREGLVADLFLCTALVALGIASVFRAFAPSLHGHNNVVVWAPIVGGLVVAIGALAAGLFPEDARVRSPRQRLLFIAGLLVVGGGAVAAASAFANQVPTGIHPDLSPDKANMPMVQGSAALLSLQIAAALLFLAAAFGFASRAARTRDELMAWIALACVFGSFARVNYFLFPSVYSDWVFTGDIFRFLAYVLVLTGAFRELGAHHRTSVRAAVLAERQRIARDLHDGLGQDLAYLSLQGNLVNQVDRLVGEDAMGDIARTAQEALLQSRAAIANLGLSDMPLAESVESLARNLTARHGITLKLDLDETLDEAPEVRDDLLRVLSEAIANAVRHGNASTIRVSLGRLHGSGVVMSIADDGSGFDPAASQGSGGATGLKGMRARIHGHGGTLRVRSEPGAGTVVQVILEESRSPVWREHFARRGAAA